MTMRVGTETQGRFERSCGHDAAHPVRNVCVGNLSEHSRRSWGAYPGDARVTGEDTRMAWDEWEQLKAQAVERHTTHMRINSFRREDGYAEASGSGGGTGTLKHKGGPWTQAAGTADDLQTSTITAKVGLRRAHDGTVGGLAGLSGLGALKSVLTSWDERLGRVREECSSLEPKLRQVAVGLAEVDAEVGDSAKAEGISATHEGGDPHVTAVGHSYGSLTVGLAAQEKGGIPGADDIILVGSPGTGADNAQDLNVGKDHVFVGAADNDIVTKLPNHAEASGMATGAVGGGSAGFVLGAGMAGPPGAVIGGGAGAIVGGIGGYMAQDAQTDPSGRWFGTDPASKDFGATRFMVDDGATLIEDRGEMSAHSNYFNPMKDQDSADNIAKIVVGKSGKISLETPR